MGVELSAGALLLGKYRVQRELGRGGMGAVVEALHVELRELVAIKVLSQELALTSELFQRFTREARAAARLKSEHVVRVSDVGMLDGGLPYMVMELLDGEDLEHALKHRGPFSPQCAVDLVLQAAEALAEAHAQGIVHRDIKPSNLFVLAGREPPHVKVLDFGIAKAEEAGPRITRTFSVLGTPAYMSPEQLRSSRNVDARSDIWALGAVLYELIEGVRPFDAEGLPAVCMQIAMQPPTPCVRTPAPLAAVVMRCLEKEPADRFASMLELAAALVPYATEPPHAQRDLLQMQQLVRASTQRVDRTPVPSPPRGRLSATDDLAPPPHVPAPPVREVGSPRSSGAATVQTPPASVVEVGARPSGALTVPNAPVARVSPPRRRRPLLIGVVATVLAGGIGAGVLLSRRDSVAADPTPPPVAAVPPPAQAPPAQAPPAQAPPAHVPATDPARATDVAAAAEDRAESSTSSAPVRTSVGQRRPTTKRKDSVGPGAKTSTVAAEPPQPPTPAATLPPADAPKPAKTEPKVKVWMEPQ